MVVIPTETVYGLACDALNKDAVKRVFDIKGRPADNPLIVHISDISQLESLAVEIPDEAGKAAERFWPGPLTLVLRKQQCVPPETTGGLDSVAIRIPRHPVALAVLRESGLALAAPSANRFTELSPTSVEDLNPAILEAADLVLDGGPCEVGVESTVLDMNQSPPRILRPGGVTAQDLKDCGIEALSAEDSSQRRSPGQYERHYAPKTRIVLVEKLREQDAGLCLSPPASGQQIQMPADVTQYQSMLYHALHQLDHANLEVIYIERPPVTAEWAAVHDRLRKASSPPS